MAPNARCVFRRDSGALALDPPPSSLMRWRAVVRVLRSPLDAASCAILPASCAFCATPLPRLTATPICDSCWAEFPALGLNAASTAISSAGSISASTAASSLDPNSNSTDSDGPGCARCADSLDPFSAASGATLCRACRLAPPPFVRAVAWGLYEGRMKEAIHALKYDRFFSVARPLGQMLAAAIAQLEGQAPAELLVVPIPLHRSKYAQRGFNQARSLAREALRSLKRTHPEWRLTLAPSTLMRLRATESQAGLTPRQRRLNVLGAFSVADAAAVAGRHVLLIDDILTTGATARAAAGALGRAGAASVWVASLARARRMGFHVSSRVSSGVSSGKEKLKEEAPRSAKFSSASSLDPFLDHAPF